MERNEARGVSSVIYRMNEETGEYEKIKAVLIFLRKDSDAKLDIISEDGMPSWIVPDAEVSMNIVWPSKGLVIFSGTVTYILGERVHIGHLSFRETIQRRKDVKVDFESVATLYSEDREYVLPVVLENISAGGIGFRLRSTPKIKEMLVPGQHYSILFETDEGKKIELMLALVRADENAENMIHCGAQFLHVRPGLEMQLRQLVFRKQKEENQKERALKNKGIIEIDVFMK